MIPSTIAAISIPTVTPLIPEEPEEGNIGLEIIKAKRERSKSAGPARATAKSEPKPIKITILNATPKAASTALAKHTAAKRPNLDIIAAPPPKKGVLQIEDVKPNTEARNAAPPADSGGASSSGAAEPKAKAKAAPRAKSAAKIPETTPEPKAKGRPRKTTPHRN